MKKAMLITAVCAALTGCLNKSHEQIPAPTVAEKIEATEPSEPLPAIDISSPDKALKSYWAVIDWKRRLDAENYAMWRDSDRVRSTNDALAKVAVSAFAKKHTPGQVETFEREIVEAKVETDTRAIIKTLIKNSTPIPPGAEVTPYAKRQRAQGDQYRYVLERDADGWKIAEVWEFDSIVDNKWIKRGPFEPKPSVAVLTFGSQ